MNQDKLPFLPADILLPRDCAYSKWSVVACDQYTSQPAYWERVERQVGQAPSALRLILPEQKLEDGHTEAHIAAINAAMEDYLALGIFLLMVPGTALNVVCYALGGVVLACAAVQLVRYFVVERGVFQSQLTLISGLVCLALGAFLIIRSDVVVRVLPIVFGLFVIFDSLGRIQNALELRRCGYPSWKIFLLLAVLSVVLGIVMVVDPFGTMETLVMAIGLILILEGALNLLSALYTMLAVRRFIKLHPETQSMLEAITGQDLNGDGVIAPDVSHADVESTAVELDYVDESAEVEQENK